MAANLNVSVVQDSDVDKPGPSLQKLSHTGWQAYFLGHIQGYR